MIIKTNTGKEIKIENSNIVVKDNKLYNKETKSFEALEGDKISFVTYNENGYKVSTTGTVDGYTCNGIVKLMGISKQYNVSGGYSIEHITKVTDYIDENAVISETVYA